MLRTEVFGLVGRPLLRVLEKLKFRILPHNCNKGRSSFVMPAFFKRLRS